MTSKVMDAKETSRYLGISYWQLLEMAKKGLVPHVRLGRRVVFRAETLDKWLSSQEEQSCKHELITPAAGKLRQVKGVPL